MRLKGFNPRPHARGDGKTETDSQGVTRFNPRPHARGDKHGSITLDISTVSIHAPTRGATTTKSRYYYQMQFQSTPPREGRLQFDTPPTCKYTVSIHAPTRGATSYKIDVDGVLIKFQSTPPREGRPCKYFKRLQYWRFQSTPPREGRHFALS